VRTTAATAPASNVCRTNPCLNGGTCQSVPGGGYRCICNQGYTGFFCSVINYAFFLFLRLLFFI